MSNKSEGQGREKALRRIKHKKQPSKIRTDRGHFGSCQNTGAAREPPEKTTAVSLEPFAADLNGKETDDDGSDEIITHVARSP